MAVTFTNRREVEAYVQDALQEHVVASHTVNISAVVDELYAIAGGSWDVQHIDDDVFWATVTRHQNNENTP